MSPLDPLHNLRTVLGGKRGSLMEQGLAPLLISAALLNTLVGKGGSGIDMRSKGNREAFALTQKVVTLFISLIMAVVGLTCGQFGPLEYLGYPTRVLIALQLLGASLMVILLDDMLQKGHGLGNAISLLCMSNVFGQIMWDCISFSSVTSPAGT